jgi:hypothetical protein
LQDRVALGKLAEAVQSQTQLLLHMRMKNLLKSIIQQIDQRDKQVANPETIL